MIRRITALAAGALLTAALATAAAVPAAATTPTCTNIATTLPGTPTAPADFWNAGITLAPYSASDATQDFTVYEVCTFTGGVSPVSPTEAFPCGINGSPVIDPVSGFGEFAAEVTPLGHHLGAVINSLANLCLSVEAVSDGPLHDGHHALRWHVVLRTCDTYGAHFTAGMADGSSGIPGVVNFANHFQTWSPIPANGGYVLGNNALSSNFLNHPFVLDARGGRGPSVIAYPENDQANEIWKVIGCTNPVTSLTPGFFDCP